MSSAISIPADWEPHATCWMAWAANKHDWGSNYERVKGELARIITTVAAYEHVRLLAPYDCVGEASGRFATHDVEIVPAPVDDIWMRDIMPTSARRGNERIWIDWNFNGWGNTADRRSRPGDRLAGFIASITGDPLLQAPFIAEGGAFVTNGDGVMLATKSCLLNANRNPAFGRSRKALMRTIEEALTAFGSRHVVWLEGDPDEPVTSGHVDGFAMFASSHSLIVEANGGYAAPSRRGDDIISLRTVHDRGGRLLDVALVAPPRSRFGPRGRMAARSYLNAYFANGAVITAKFGDDVRDKAAEDALRLAFPGRDIVMLRMDTIASGGGGVRCITQPMI